MNLKERQQIREAEAIASIAATLARHDKFSQHWLDHPTWAGVTPDIQPLLDKAAKYKEWARDIFHKRIPPPAWLAKQDPALQNKTRNTTKPSRIKRPKPRIAWAGWRRPPKKPEPVPRKCCAGPVPTREEIEDLAILLQTVRTYPDAIFRYPLWASYPVWREFSMQHIAFLKSRAEAILLGKELPPAWLARRECWQTRYAARPPVQTESAPDTLDQAERVRLLRTAPSILAWFLAATALQSAPRCNAPVIIVWHPLPHARAGPECFAPPGPLILFTLHRENPAIPPVGSVPGPATQWCCCA